MRPGNPLCREEGVVKVRTVTLVALVVVFAGAFGPLQPTVAQGFGCQFEKIEYISDGLTIRSGVFYNGDGMKRPILVYSRGTSTTREAEQRPASESGMRQSVACQFVMTYNWTVFVAERRGYGGSDGESWRAFAAQTGRINDRAAQGVLYARRLQDESRDVLAGITVIQGRPYARQEHAVWGISAGGIISLLIGGNPLPGLLAVISSVGGLGWNLASGCTTCYYKEVFAAATEAGLQTNVPIILQAGSADPFLIPNRQLYNDLKAAGKDVTLTEYEGFKHEDFGAPTWRTNIQDIARFLLTLQPPVASSRN